MIKFITSNYIPADPGKINIDQSSCPLTGMKWIYQYKGSARVICVNGNNYYATDTLAKSKNITLGLLTFSTQMLLSSLANKILVDISTDATLYKSSTNIRIILADGNDYLVQNSIGSTQLLGSFSGKSKYDVYIDGRIYLHDLSYQASPLLVLPSLNWCAGVVRVTDFNGDKLSDLLCIQSNNYIMLVNTGTSFLLMPGYENGLGNLGGTLNNFNQNVVTGDFDGNGLADLLVINEKPQIVFGDPYKIFTYRSEQDSSFNINDYNGWCANAQATNLLITDFNNDKKDDILCLKSGNAYLMISQNYPQGTAISNVKVSFSNFRFLDGSATTISDYSVPFLCNATKIQDHRAKLNCAASTPTTITSLSTQMVSVAYIPNFQINAIIKNQFNENLANGPSVINVNSQYTATYFKGLKTAIKRKDSYSTSQIQLVTATACYRMDINFISISKNYTASGEMSVYGINGKIINDQAALKRILQVYLFNCNNIVVTSESTVTFTIKGQIGINTVYENKAADCSRDNVNPQLLINPIARPNPIYPQNLCLLTPASQIQYPKGISVISRQDIIDMHGVILPGTQFYPSDIVTYMEPSLDTYNHDLDVYDLQSSAIFEEGISVTASVVSNNDICPRSRVQVDFRKNNVTLTTLPLYAAFDNIRKVKLEPFAAGKMLFVLSLYQYETQQFYILLDYTQPNKDNHLLRINSFDGLFSIITYSTFSFVIAYKEDAYNLAIIEFEINDSGNFVEVGQFNKQFQSENILDYQIKKQGDNYFTLIWSYGDIRGIFAQTYDLNFNTFGSEKNIICYPDVFKTDTYEDSLFIIWHGLTNNFNSTSFYFQHIKGESFLQRQKLFNANLGYNLNGIQFKYNATLATAANQIGIFIPIGSTQIYYGNIPGSISISTTYGNNMLMLNFDTNLTLASISSLGIVQSSKALVLNINNPDANSDVPAKALEITATTLGAIGMALMVADLAMSAAEAASACECAEEEGKTEAEQAEAQEEAESAQEEVGEASEELEGQVAERETQLEEQAETTSEEIDSASTEMSEITTNLEEAEALTAEAEEGVEGAAEAAEAAEAAADAAEAAEAIEEIDIVAEEVALDAAATGNPAGAVVAAVGLAIVVATITAEIALDIYLDQAVWSNNGKIAVTKVTTTFNNKITVLNTNLDQSDDLKASLEFIYNGLTNALPYMSNLAEIPFFQDYVNSIICKKITPPEYLLQTIVGLIQMLESPLVFQYHDSYYDGRCTSNQKYYPGYIDGSIIHICPNFDTTDLDASCRAKAARNLFGLQLADLVVGFVSLGIVHHASEYPSTVSEIDEKCHEGYVPDVNLVHKLSDMLLPIMLQEKPHLMPTIDNCTTMTINNCNDATSRQLNSYCIGYFATAVSIGYNFTQLNGISNAVVKNCNYGCQVTDIAAKYLLNYVGGYLNKVDPTFAKGNDLITSILSNGDLLTVSSLNFYNQNLTFYTSIYNQSGAFKVTGKFYNTSSGNFGNEQELGRFLNIGSIATTAFNSSAILFAAAVNNFVGKYNILIEYFSQGNNQVLNVYPSYNGIFSVTAVPATSDFLVSFMPDNHTISVRKYTITTNNITEQYEVNQTAAPSYMPRVTLRTFADGTFSLIWNYLNSLGIFMQGYYINNGTAISQQINIPSSPQIVLVSADGVSQGVIAWQEIDGTLKAQMFNDGQMLYAPIKFNWAKSYYLIDATALGNEIFLMNTLVDSNTTIVSGYYANGTLIFSAQSNGNSAGSLSRSASTNNRLMHAMDDSSPPPCPPVNCNNGASIPPGGIAGIVIGGIVIVGGVGFGGWRYSRPVNNNNPIELDSIERQQLVSSNRRTSAESVSSESGNTGVRRRTPAQRGCSDNSRAALEKRHMQALDTECNSNLTPECGSTTPICTPLDTSPLIQVCNAPSSSVAGKLSSSKTALSNALNALSINTLPSTLYPDYVNIICATIPPAGWNNLYPLYVEMSTALQSIRRYIFSKDSCTITSLSGTDITLCSDFKAVTRDVPNSFDDKTNMLFIIARAIRTSQSSSSEAQIGTFSTCLTTATAATCPTIPNPSCMTFLIQAQKISIDTWIFKLPDIYTPSELGGGANPSIKIKDNNGINLAAGKTIQTDNWKSLATITSSHLLQSMQGVSNFIQNTIIPDNRLMIPTLDYQGNSYRVASMWINDVTRLHEMFGATCPNAFKCIPWSNPTTTDPQDTCRNNPSYQGDKEFRAINDPNPKQCVEAIYNKVVTFEPRSVASYLMSQLLIGGGDFSTGNIAYKNSDNTLFKFDLDHSFTRSKAGAPDSNDLACFAERLDAIYNPINIEWNLFKEMLVHDGNLLFPTPRAAKWVIVNNNIQPQVGNPGLPTIQQCDLGKDQGLLGLCVDSVSSCRREIINDLQNGISKTHTHSKTITSSLLPNQDFENNYCNFLKEVFIYLDQYREEVKQLDVMDDWTKAPERIYYYLKNINAFTSGQHCDPQDFVMGLDNWFQTQYNAIIHM
jgi:hypothetical protein